MSVPPAARESAGARQRTCESACFDLPRLRPTSADGFCAECLSLETRVALFSGEVLDLVVDS
jgi:hypothetical protein